MAVRTYLPSLRDLLTFLCNYITRHRVRILAAIGDQHAVELDALIAACHVVTDIILPLIPTGE